MRALILGLVLVLGVTTASADDKQKAKALYDQGLKHYNVAEYPEAIKAWKEAYLLSKRALLLFNIGQAYRLSGDCKQAMIFYDSYQREAPNPKNQDELDQALSLCKNAKPADKPADKPVVTAPQPPPPVKPVAQVQQPPPPPEEEEVDEPEPTTSGGGLRKIGIGVAVAGAVAGGIGVYFLLDSASASGDLDGYMGEWGQEQIDLEARGKSSATKGYILSGVGVAAIIGGSVLFTLGAPKEVTAVSVVPTKSGVQVGWSYRF